MIKIHEENADTGGACQGGTEQVLFQKWGAARQTITKHRAQNTKIAYNI